MLCARNSRHSRPNSPANCQPTTLSRGQPHRPQDNKGQRATTLRTLVLQPRRQLRTVYTRGGNLIRHTETEAKTTIKGARPFPAPLGHSSGVHGPRDVPGAPDCPVAALGELAWCCWAAMRVRRSWEQQQRPARGSSCGPLDGRVVRSLAPDGHPCTPGDPLRRVTPRGGSGGRGWCAVVGCPRRRAEQSQRACARRHAH